MAENVQHNPNRMEIQSGNRYRHVSRENKSIAAESRKENTSIATGTSSSYSEPSIPNQQTQGVPSSKILRNRSIERIQAGDERTSLTVGTELKDVNIRQQPWESPSYTLGVPLNEFRPAHDFCEGCDESDDAINSSMSVASECSLNTTSSSLEEHVLQLLENYQSDGNGSVRSACENPVARTLMNESAFRGDMLHDDNVSSPRRYSSPTAVGSSPPESASHRPAALHASASAPILYFSPAPR